MALAVVTGASRGLGHAVAEELAVRRYDVINVSRSQGAANWRTVPLDLEDAEAISDALRGDLGRYLDEADILVNNAGRVVTADVDSATVHDMQMLYQLHVVTPLLLARRALRSMKARGQGSIVNVGTIAVRRPRATAGVPYTLSKSALHTATKLLALKGAPDVRCNTILPGIMDTRMQRELTGENVPELARIIPMGRLGVISEVARHIVYVAVDATYITGEEIAVAGGLGV